MYTQVTVQLFTLTHIPSPTPTATEQAGWEYAYYTYSSSHTHAVSSVARSGGTSYTQVFNAEGRLASITDGTDTWTFTYDGDGNRIKQGNPDGTTTLFLGGGAYEVQIDGQTKTVTKY